MYCETYEDGSWYCSYDDGSETIGYPDGTTADNGVAGSVGFDYNALAQAGIDAATTILASRGYQVQARSPLQTYNGAIPGIAASAGSNRSGVGGSLNVSTNTLILIAAGVLLFMMGTKKGR